MAVKTFAKSRAVPEGSTRRYQAKLVDYNGVTLQSGQVTRIRFSLIDARTGDVINGRDRMDVRNIPGTGGTWSPDAAPGYYYQILSDLDTVTTDTEAFQPRRAIFEITFLDGIENHEVFFWIRNLSHLVIDN